MTVQATRVDIVRGGGISSSTANAHDAGTEAGGAERVGHDLTLGSLIPRGARGVGRFGECRIGGDTLGGGQQRGHIRHAIGCRPDGYVPIGLGFADPVHDAVRVEPVGDLLGFRSELPGRHVGQVRAEFGVHDGPIARRRKLRVLDARGTSRSSPLLRVAWLDPVST